MKQKLGVYAAVTFAMIFWALSFIWYKQVYEYYNPITTVLFRLVLSSAFLYIVTLSMKKLQRMRKKDLPLFILATFFEPFLYFLGESFGVKFVSSTLAAVIVSTIPLFSPVATAFFFRERLSFINLSGLVISVVGVFVVILSQSQGGVTASPLGIACLSLAVVAAIGYSIVIRKLTEKYNSFTIVTYQNSLGILFFAPLFFIFEYRNFIQVPFNSEVLVPLLQLSIFASTFAFVFFTYAISNIGVTKANIFANTIPVFTAFFAWFLLDEALGMLKMLGIGVVLIGLYMSQVQFTRQKLMVKKQ